jgi:multidrug efflux system membrane fusion protein
MSPRSILVGLLVLLAAGALAWQVAVRNGTAATTKGAKGGPPLVPVLAAEAARQTVAVRISTIGTVQAEATVAVKSRIEGHLLEARFREGQAVRKDDLLFRIDPRPIEAQLRQAEANVARDRANLERAAADLKRSEDLTRRGIAPQQKLDEAKAAVAALEATLKADQAAAEFARLHLGYTDIPAPIDGRTGSLLVHPGNLVKANDVALVVINQTRPIQVAFAVPERHLNEITARLARTPLAVTATVPETAGPPAGGEVVFVNNAVDPATGTIQVKARFANEDERLVPGQFVNVALTLREIPDAVVVPAPAIQVGQKGPFVFVIGDDRAAQMRPVRLGPLVDGLQVVQEGVSPGERVVTDGHVRLFPGARVEVRAPRGPAAGPPG